MARYQVKALLAYSVVIDVDAESVEQAREQAETKLMLEGPGTQALYDHPLDTDTWITWISE